MRKNNPNRLPPLGWCEYQIMQKIGSSNGITRYALETYVEKLENCEKPYKNYHKIDNLIRKWKKQGFVSLQQIHEKSNIMMVEITEYGKEFLERLDDWYGFPAT